MAPDVGSRSSCHGDANDDADAANDGTEDAVAAAAAAAAVGGSQLDSPVAAL